MVRPKFSDIPKRIQFCGYQIDVNLNYIHQTLEGYRGTYGLELCPDFQRGHVWTVRQQIAFCEFILTGGKTSPILFNHTHWDVGDPKDGRMVCVDGLQRVTALRRMMTDEIKVFGHFFGDYEDRVIKCRRTHVKFCVNNLRTDGEVLLWYLQLNDGGTVHSEEELKKVRQMLQEWRDDSRDYNKMRGNMYHKSIEGQAEDSEPDPETDKLRWYCPQCGHEKVESGCGFLTCLSCNQTYLPCTKTDGTQYLQWCGKGGQADVQV